MGLLPDDILVGKEAKVIEHIFESDGIIHHEINLLKNVYLNKTDIKSCEGHIAFEWVPLKLLPEYKVLPASVKKHILDAFCV